MTTTTTTTTTTSLYTYEQLRRCERDIHHDTGIHRESRGDGLCHRLDSRFERIYDEIRSDPFPRKIVYVGIGASHKYDDIRFGVVRRTGLEIFLENEGMDQQYPYFLRRLNSLHGHDYRIYIILIDPCLESPCFTVVKKTFDPRREGPSVHRDWHEVRRDVYSNPEKNIVLMENRFSVSYGDVDSETIQHNILPFFECLVDASMRHNWFTVVMDFSGSTELDHLALRYDSIIPIEHQKHILFGLPTRPMSVCYPDLSLPENQIVTRSGTPLVAVIPRLCSDSEKRMFLKMPYSPTSSTKSGVDIVCRIQLDKYNEQSVTRFKGGIMMILRKFMVSRNDPTIEIRDNEIERISDKISIDEFRMMEKDVPDRLMFKLSEMFDSELHDLLKCTFQEEKYARICEVKTRGLMGLIVPYDMDGQISKILKE